MKNRRIYGTENRSKLQGLVNSLPNWEILFDEKRVEATRMFLKGSTLTEISLVYGVTRQCIHNWLFARKSVYRRLMHPANQRRIKAK